MENSRSESQSDLVALRNEAREFVNERDWQQFQTPKNLAIALSVEASELLEPFQWLQTGSITELREEKLQDVRHEMADVLIYLIRLADELQVDLYSAVKEKMVLNRQKYPVEKVKGDARKYSDY